jgi:hypothetical protein
MEFEDGQFELNDNMDDSYHTEDNEGGIDSSDYIKDEELIDT